ncbi:protein SPIRRIG-like [Chenopodium quinoa]|uniref:protein SPIRRIG-like n=1 Tax=Chenopodium quinoa TaxID=63459 RepID=UPI000B7967FB|nr:protein SPIRRIG-like [Chenopodium quinoa]
MESWVTTLFKDIKEKVGFESLSQLSEVVEVPPRTDTSYDYLPSRLSPPELRLLIQYVLQLRLIDANHNLNNILGRLLFMEHLAYESASFAPCLEFDMSNMGHACIVASLGERVWSPKEGYSFVCWFQYRGLKSMQTEHQATMKLRLFSVSSTASENSFVEELFLQQDGVLTLATNNTLLLSSSSLGLEEGEWYHLAIVQSNRDDVTAKHFSGTVHIYVNGKLSDTAELAYTPMLAERELQITIGTPANHARVSYLQWRLRSCYLFQEPLSADFIRFMYMLVRGNKTLLQGSDISHSNGDEDGEGVRNTDSSSDNGIERLYTIEKVGRPEVDGSETIWDMKMLEKLWLQLFGKKLLCAFNAVRIEALPASQTLALLNLVDPMSVVVPSIGIPHFGELYGDIAICRRCIIGNVVCPVTGIAVILATIESAETRNMLHIALTLFASALTQNFHRAEQMKACKGYQLLSLFLGRKIAFFDMKCLQILFKIVVFEDPLKVVDSQTIISSAKAMPQAISLEVDLEDQDSLSSINYHGEINDFFTNGKTSNYVDGCSNDTEAYLLISGAISDVDIVEHVLLDWTLWVTAPVSIQLEILNFFENLVSAYKFKDHNLGVLRERNIVEHLLAAFHRDGIEVLVLEKFVILLAVILEHKFLDTELENVTSFVLTTFEPPEVMKPSQFSREVMSKRVTLRNILLETLIDLQVTIVSEELLEHWHKIVSSQLIANFLDKAIHPTSMIWIITLLGLCFTSSPTFPLKFESNGGFEELSRVLPSFHEFLDIYYIIFCLIFNKPIYPKLPEVGISDFEALMLTNEEFGDLKFARLLDSIVAMVKFVFDQLRVQPNLAQQALDFSQSSDVDLAEANMDIIEELGGEEALDHKTHTTSLHGLEASATDAISILRFMANSAKMTPSFSKICKRTEFLESCVDLYFSIVRAYMAVKLVIEPYVLTTSTSYSILACEGNESPSAKLGSHTTSTEDSSFLTTSHLMLELDNSTGRGKLYSVGATAILDLIAEVLSVTLIGHVNSIAIMESILWSGPLYLDSESALTFQALCLSRVMTYLERRLLYSDERNGQILDKNILWSNLGSFCNLIVDCVYIRVFPQPSAVMKVLEFCFLMLHSAKKDGQNEESSLPWTGLLSILRGSRPIDVILKSTNRMVLYCFLPSFLASTREDPLISQEETRVDVCIVLELIHAHKEIIFHSSNADIDLYCSLCISLISLISDEQTDARNLAMSILKFLLVHCRASLEDVLISKTDHNKPLDVLNGGFDKLLTENSSTFIMWFQRSEHDVKHVLQQFASVRWSKFITESEKFRREKFESLEDHWTAKMGKKTEHTTKLDPIYWDQCADRKTTLAATQNTTRAELGIAYRKKDDLILHAESEWRSQFEQLGHEHKFELISSLAWEDYWPL